MKTLLTAQQLSFFTKHGFIEFEIKHPYCPPTSQRDQWREIDTLKNFLLKTIGPLAKELLKKSGLRLGLDQWILTENRPQKFCSLKEMFSLQGVAIGISLTHSNAEPPRKPSLGILPVPSNPQNILFFQPHILLNWPETHADVYLASLTFLNAVYVHSPQDLATNHLKQFGYQYGDILNNKMNPMI